MGGPDNTEYFSNAKPDHPSWNYLEFKCTVCWLTDVPRCHNTGGWARQWIEGRLLWQSMLEKQERHTTNDRIQRHKVQTKKEISYKKIMNFPPVCCLVILHSLWNKLVHSFRGSEE